MRTSFHLQPEAQHPIFQLSWQADYPIFSRVKRTSPAPCELLGIEFSEHRVLQSPPFVARHER